MSFANSPSCLCCEECEATVLGQWEQEPDGEPVDPNDDADILAVDEFNQVQAVQLYAEASSTDRSQGYHVSASFNDLVVRAPLPDRDMVSLWLDGGSHEVRLRFEWFSAAHAWGFSCQHSVPETILVQLWRGATKLAEVRVPNEINTAGIGITSVYGSLHGTEFCGGFGRGFGNESFVKTTTTSTHNGGECWVAILDKGARYHYRTSISGGAFPLSEEIAVTSMTLTTCLTQCPECLTCEDTIYYDGSYGSPLTVFVPDYLMALFSGGPVACSGGTFVLDYYGSCLWSHASDNALIYVQFATVSGTLRLQMKIVSCLGYTCSGFETPVVSTWLSGPLDSPVLCLEFDALELTTTVSGTTYTAEVSDAS